MERLPPLVLQSESDSVRKPANSMLATVRRGAGLLSIDIRAMASTSGIQRRIRLRPKIKGGCDMVADWIVIYAGVVVLAAAVAGDVPSAQRPRFEVSIGLLVSAPGKLARP